MAEGEAVIHADMPIMPPNSDAIEHAKPFGDGFLTTRGTFQKYYTQEQLRENVRQTIGEDPIAIAPGIRSEEHTSELQSRRNLVCRPLL